MVHYTTVKADRSEVRVIKQCCGMKPPLCEHKLSTRDQPESAMGYTVLSRTLVFTEAECNPPQEEPAVVVKPYWHDHVCGRLFHACISHQVLEDIQQSTWALCYPHSITEMTADVRSHSQTHCGKPCTLRHAWLSP